MSKNETKMLVCGQHVTFSSSLTHLLQNHKSFPLIKTPLETGHTQWPTGSISLILRMFQKRMFFRSLHGSPKKNTPPASLETLAWAAVPSSGADAQLCGHTSHWGRLVRTHMCSPLHMDLSYGSANTLEQLPFPVQANGLLLQGPGLNTVLCVLNSQ